MHFRFLTDKPIFKFCKISIFLCSFSLLEQITIIKYKYHIYQKKSELISKLFFIFKNDCQSKYKIPILPLLSLLLNIWSKLQLSIKLCLSIKPTLRVSKILLTFTAVDKWTALPTDTKGNIKILFISDMSTFLNQLLFFAFVSTPSSNFRKTL